MTIDILSLVLSIVAAILIVVGFFGSFLPVIPGPPLAWFGLLSARFSSYNNISKWTLLITAIVAVFLTMYFLL